jgi:DNA repair exonuclease SbcCD nuclease subunit
MARLLLLTDTHLGVRGNNEHFHTNMRLFYERVFFPLFDKVASKIDGVVHLGDVFDDRRKIDIKTARLAREYFFTPLFQRLTANNLEAHIICGNHDSYYRDELTVNSLSEFIEHQVYDGSGRKPFRIHTSVTEVPEWNTIMVPWITSSNRAETESALARTSCRYLMGHLELNGFNFSKVQVATHGDDPQNLKKFDKVLSGHYHYRHTKDNVTYLGSPTEHTWIDVGTDRGFHILDTDSGELKFISNPYNIFELVEFGAPLEDKHPRFVRMFRNGDEAQSKVDAYVKQLFDSGAISVDIIVKNIGKGAAGVANTSDTIDAPEDTPIFIRNNVEDTVVADILIDLYNRAVSNS